MTPMVMWILPAKLDSNYSNNKADRANDLDELLKGRRPDLTLLRVIF